MTQHKCCVEVLQVVFSLLINFTEPEFEELRTLAPADDAPEARGWDRCDKTQVVA